MENLMKEEVTKLKRAIQPKQITLAHINYMNNRVLIPKLKYLSKTAIISVQKCNLKVINGHYKAED